MDTLTVTGITVDMLVKWQQNVQEEVLILDSRPFISYNEGHIVTATNVHCPPILKRRSGGFVALENIVPCSEKRERLENGEFKRIIVYDGDTVDLEQSAKDSNLYSVLKSLRQQIEVGELCYIKGGYKEFSSMYPQMCRRQSKLTTCSTLNVEHDNAHRQEAPVEILPFLYLGNFQDASNLELLHRLGITSLMNVSTKCKNLFEQDFSYMNVPVDDNPNADLAVWFPQSNTFIDTVRENRGKVLVHCQAGVSRSATICLAYLMYTAKVGLETAFEHIKSRRSVISPNLNFMRQLENYEKEIKSHDGTLNTSVSDSSMDSSMDTSSSNETASSTSSGLQSTSGSSLSQGQVFGGGAFDFTFSPTFSSPNTPLLSPS
ncbi:dual specificity protein phosphatase 4-like [Ostrea edulis]|uniref:dual specificity protein phosphatase 4-like n=1 Tax=Ostrea edulis TaxID=37623 RepID=UPI0024AE9924|nr:dual specificity protein phosphatase 4-like [Ostrea edulis]